MALMTEFKERKAVVWTEQWTGLEFERKPTAYAPYNKSFIVLPRRYEGSSPKAVPALVRNCADASDAKQAYYLETGLDPSTQYTDVQVYEPAGIKQQVQPKAKISETLPARATL